MSSIIHSQITQIPHGATTTGFDLPGFRIVECLVACGNCRRAVTIMFGTVGAGLQTLLGEEHFALHGAC